MAKDGEGAEEKRKRMPMADWFHPGLLVQTGIRVAVSTAFGEMADRREAIAAANAIADQPRDPGFIYTDEHRRNGDFWLDFMADTGDGWDSTFAMAQLVTAPHLQPGDSPLPRGQILILGGDMVYPTASREEYDNRFLYPFEEAAKRTAGDPAAMPDLYAIPGNHDWYDGLSAFFNLFCRRRIAGPGAVGINRPGRKIAGRPTKQTRSYFAIQLPGGWWLWGTDSQLKGYIDQPQIDFFQFVASNWMEDNSKLILCVGMPNWAYVDERRPDKEFSTFSYLERLAGMARRPHTAEEQEAGETGTRAKNHQLRLVLTGDSHHYSRFEEPRSDGQDPVQYITCGGGGAFLHPTHQLASRRFEWDYPPPNSVTPGTAPVQRQFDIARKEDGSAALFPEKDVSARLTRANWTFAWRNWPMTLVFFAAYLLFNWILNTNARLEDYPSLVHAVSAGGWVEAPFRYAWVAFASPWPVLMFCLAMGGYYYFADSPYDKAKRAKIGLLHGLAQTGAATLVTAILLRAIGATGFGDTSIQGPLPTLGVGLTLFTVSALAAIVSATVFGGYLKLSLDKWGRHWNEAFSALAIADYKCFLRLRITKDDELEVYAVGLEKVPAGGGTLAEGQEDTLRPHLIEGPIPIR
jgi:hypothetical protein